MYSSFTSNETSLGHNFLGSKESGLLQTHSADLVGEFKKYYQSLISSNYHGNYIGYKKEESKGGNGDRKKGRTGEGKKGNDLVFSFF